MKINELFTEQKRTFSFEFFPPKDYLTAVKFGINAGQLMKLNPSFVSITYGAGGSSHKHTFDLVNFFQNDLGFNCMAHYTVLNTTREKIAYDMRTLQDMGIENVMLLRGDPPKGSSTFPHNTDGFNHASDLISFVRKNFDFSIGAAAYPEKHVESKSIDDDIDYLWQKVDAGADFLITQMFFDNQYYWEYLNKVVQKGITCRIIPGIIPITNYMQIKRFAEISGARIPESIHKAMAEIQDQPLEMYRKGLEIAKIQSMELLENGASGIHVFTLNKSRAAIELFDHLPMDNKRL
jgi:methylenetetrahydrofolate reductase (NADPH)